LPHLTPYKINFWVSTCLASGPNTASPFLEEEIPWRGEERRGEERRGNLSSTSLTGNKPGASPKHPCSQWEHT